VRVAAFLSDMATPYAWCDAVLCRAGATSLAELAAAGRPAVLVPFPHATDNHQEHNARALVDAGGGAAARVGVVAASLATAIWGAAGGPGPAGDDADGDAGRGAAGGGGDIHEQLVALR
jgi:UDP-N-acetylglucosamine--N-acetylmuramyl-(pentapeptide) pyrophosphoryl-undecaprenol N-acetylglucosamine transferase